MGEAEKREISKQDWFINLAERLRSYKELAARVNILDIELLRNVGPDAKMIATYGEQSRGTHEEISPKEVELFDKEQELKKLNSALDALLEDERGIIRLRYIEQVHDWHIYDLKIRMSKSLYYTKRNQAMVKMALALGYSVDKIWTKYGQSVEHKAEFVS